MFTSTFSVWSQGVPVILAGADNTFGTWSQGIPLITPDEATGTETLIAATTWIVSGTGAFLNASAVAQVAGKSISFVGSSARVTSPVSIRGTSIIRMGQSAALGLTGGLAGTARVTVTQSSALGLTGGLAGTSIVRLYNGQIKITGIAHFADRRASSMQPRHRHMDYVNLDWWERRVSAKQPRRRHLRF